MNFELVELLAKVTFYFACVACVYVWLLLFRVWIAVAPRDNN